MELGAHRREPGLGYVNLFYLIPDYRGLGFGPALDAHAGGVFRQRGLTTARLQVGGDARAQRFYAKLGWRDLGKSQPPQPRFPGLRTFEKTWP
jgi:GNAT superfamily N-acetyltransferase